MQIASLSGLFAEGAAGCFSDEINLCYANVLLKPKGRISVDPVHRSMQFSMTCCMK